MDGVTFRRTSQLFLPLVAAPSYWWLPESQICLVSWSIDCNLSQRYGWNVMKFYMNSDADRKSDGMSYYNPMCAAFPTEVLLHLKSVSPTLFYRSPAWCPTLELPEVNSITTASAFSHRCLSPNTSTHFRLFCAEHHKREDLLGALVLVRLSRPGLLHVLLLPGLHHPRLWTTLQPVVQDGRFSIMLSLKRSPRSVTNGTKT